MRVLFKSSIRTRIPDYEKVLLSLPQHKIIQRIRRICLHDQAHVCKLFVHECDREIP